MTTSVSDSIDHLDAGYDVIIRRDRMSRPNCICQRFLDDVSIAVASPDLAGIEAVRSPCQLLNMPLLHMHSRPDAWVRWFRAAEVPVTETLSGPFYDHFFLSLQAAITRLGVALAPRVLIEDDLATGRLKFVLPHIAVEGAGFFALFRARPAERFEELGSFVAWPTSQSAGRTDRLNG